MPSIWVQIPPPQPHFQASADKRLTIGRSSRGAAAPRSSVQSPIVSLRSAARYPVAAVRMMARITLDIPESALSALRLSPNEFAREMRVAAALLWYSHGEVSQAVGAAIAGVSRAEFIDELARRRISVVQATSEELQKEMHRE